MSRIQDFVALQWASFHREDDEAIVQRTQQAFPHLCVNRSYVLHTLRTLEKTHEVDHPSSNDRALPDLVG